MFRDRSKEGYGVPLPELPSPKNFAAWIREDRRRRKVVAWWAVTIVVAIALVVEAPRISRAIKGWQARRLSAEASVLLDQQNWQEASKKILTAFQLRNTEPEVSLAYARLLSRTGQGTVAVQWWQKISLTRQLSIPDRRDYAAAALSARELAIASEQVAFLLAQPGGSTPADLQLAGQLATLRGYTSSALKYAEQILADPRASPREQFAANVIALANTSPESPPYRLASERIVQMARDESNSASAQALAFLAQQRTPAKLTAPASESIDVTLPDSSNTTMSLKEIAERLDRNPNSRPFHRMLALELQLRAQPGNEDQLVAKAIEDYGEGDDETLIALGSWLYSHRRFQSVLDVIPLDRAVERRELLLEHIDALAALNRLSDVKEMLLTEHAVLEQAAQHMYLAVVRSKLNDATAASNEWVRALQTANSPRALIGLAEYAEKMGVVDIADAAYARLVEKQPELKPAYLARFQLAQSVGQTAKAHELALEIMRLWPEDDATHMREIYLRLLLSSEGQEAKTAENEAAPFLSKNPWDGSARSAVAFAQLKQGKFAAALNTLTEFTPGVPSSAISQAVYAAALAANGWKDKAREQAQQLTPENILPEERSLIAPLLEHH